MSDIPEVNNHGLYCVGIYDKDDPVEMNDNYSSKFFGLCQCSE